MNDNILSIDARLLRLFLRVYEAGSVSEAAVQLSLNQSTVSIGLDRLRKILNDPLFIRAGRGIVPTPHAIAIVDEVRAVLDNLERLVAGTSDYEPALDEGRFSLSTSDFEWSLVGHVLTQKLQQLAPRCELKVSSLQSHDATLADLRAGKLDVCLRTSLEMNSNELYERHLLTDRIVAFYDAATRSPPLNEAYWQARHARIVFSSNEQSDINALAAARGKNRRVCLIVPSFAYLANAIEGTDLVVTVPSLLKKHTLKNLSFCSPPFELPVPIYAIWHQRNHQNARQIWFRQILHECALALA